VYPISLFPKAFVNDPELPLLLDEAPLTGPPLLAIGVRGGGGYIVVVEREERVKLSWLKRGKG
jgi:hypothetical protein